MAARQVDVGAITAGRPRVPRKDECEFFGPLPFSGRRPYE
jgi:hypothetical protein